MLVVLDTDILVSSLWNKEGAPAKIVGMILERKLTPCHDFRILSEYRQVLRRPKFNFIPSDADDLIDFIRNSGVSIAAAPSGVRFADESDRKFYEVAKSLNAVLITGNNKHFPAEPFIMTPAGFIRFLETNETFETFY